MRWLLRVGTATVLLAAIGLLADPGRADPQGRERSRVLIAVEGGTGPHWLLEAADARA